MEGLGVSLKNVLSFTSILGSESLAAIEPAGPVVSHPKTFTDSRGAADRGHLYQLEDVAFRQNQRLQLDNGIAFLANDVIVVRVHRHEIRKPDVVVFIQEDA
jgi:hypothetical protein